MNERSTRWARDDDATSRRCSARGRTAAHGSPRRWRRCGPRSRRNGARRWPPAGAGDSSPAGRRRRAWRWPRLRSGWRSPRWRRQPARGVAHPGRGRRPAGRRRRTLDPARRAASVKAGAQLRTGSGGRAALRLTDGVELRLDSRHARRVRGRRARPAVAGRRVCRLRRRRGAERARLRARHARRRVRHLGTQYEARLAGRGLRVAFARAGCGSARRAGAVHRRCRRANCSVAAGRVERSALAPNAAEWNWLATVTPPFTLEGRSVEDSWTGPDARPAGTVVFASPEAAAAARAVTLSGTVEGLTPDEAVAAVLSTTSLRPGSRPAASTSKPPHREPSAHPRPRVATAIGRSGPLGYYPAAVPPISPPPAPRFPAALGAATMVAPCSGRVAALAAAPYAGRRVTRCCTNSACRACG